MPALTEEAFRELLDDRGILRPGSVRALAVPDFDRCYAVLAQRSDARLDVEAIKRQAERFFGARVGLTVDKRYDSPSPPEVDAARLVIASDDGQASGTRLCFGRPADAEDLAAAEAAERATGTYGLALLAQRCKTIWLVVPEAEDDRAALVLAAILASHLLGPIMSPGGHEIYGVRGARLKLEGRPSPYR